MNSFRRPFRILRQNPGQYVQGVWVPGAQVEMGITASIQPVRTSDYDQLQALMGGSRVEHAIRIYTSDVLLSDRTLDGAQYGADLVLYPALPFPPGYPGPQHQYKVVGSAAWQSGVINHRKFLAVSIGTT